MPNTSATGGYLSEIGVPPANDQELRRFLHSVIAGVTGITGSLVRQSWSLNPATIPDYDVDWCSFGITAQRQDDNPAEQQLSDDSALLTRNEEIDVSCVFYGENCQSTSSSLRDGLYLTQNQETLFLANMALIGFNQITHIPELINNRYFDRCDLTMTLNRQIQREYPILSILKAVGTVYSNNEDITITKNFETPTP